jgi:hypothetical protein
MSAHLANLSRAGLVTSSKLGRVVTYAACPSAVQDLCAFLAKASGAAAPIARG